jgi:hypothetical protein
VTQGGEVGETMRGIEKQATFYRGYLTDDRSLTPLTVAWATIVALWSLVYLVGCIGPLATESPAQWCLATRPVSP